jgi:hypothetical protein
MVNFIISFLGYWILKIQTVDLFCNVTENDDHVVHPNNHPTEHKDDPRYAHAKTINMFIKYTKLLSDGLIDKLVDDIEAGQVHVAEQKKIVKYDLEQ